jgi:phage terminase large subunit
LVFDNWKIEPVDITQIKGELLCGLDFGFVADSTALICSLLDEENRKIYVFNEVFQKGLLNNQIANIIIGLGLSKSAIIADSSEMKSIEEIKQLGVRRIRPAVKGAGSILQGIQKLKQYQIVIDPSCGNLIEEFNNYSWKKDKNTNEYINEPEDK